MKRFLLSIWLAFALVLGADAAGPKSVLFVGNSYTFALPAALAKLTARTHPETKFDLVAKGGWTLANHVEKATTDRFSNGWNVIVFQEQSQLPSFAPEQVDAQCVPAAKTLVEAARKIGATPLLYQTWGRKDGDPQHGAGADSYSNMQARLVAGYDRMAAASGARVVPVGKAWQIARTRQPGIELYVQDGSHPSPAGIYLVACVFYATLFNEDPTNLRETGGLPLPTARQLREVARDAVRAK